ncbi:MAG TPA: ABC transporter permease [Actinomycetota bacterium]|nr:ABC transporter permease [Actinomycetota bacterium]
MTGVAQYAALSRRAILNTFRQPAAIVPALLFPLLFLAMSAAAFERSTSLPGFPQVESFLQFVIAATIVQGALFGAVAAGADMATDIEGGFFERLIASPVARSSILVGRVMGAATLGFFQALLYFGVAIAFGLHVAGGLPAVFMVALTAAVLSAGIGSITVAFALRTGSTEAVQGAFPLVFVVLFISSAFFPRELMGGWFKSAATLNPISHMIEGLRFLVIEGLSGPHFFTAFGISTAVLGVGLALAGRALGGRLASRA